ncbi:MAG: DUF2142 domain-containing protein [Nocardioidaceae bacterium]
MTTHVDVRREVTAEAAPVLVARRATRSAVWLIVIGFVALQMAWITAVPPFRGSDEFDHAYRAAAVARGQWVAPPSDATRGTGAMVLVPPDIVAAAHAECSRLHYTTKADCSVPSVEHHGLVEMPSGAGRYNPVFYFVIGSAALPFHGSTALYVMRFVTAGICALFLGLAAWSTTRSRRGHAPMVALLVAATPVLVYSTAVAAPNGPEMAAALALWASLLALTRATESRQKLWLVAASSGAVLLTLRSLGPLWFALTLVAVAALVWRPRRTAEQLRACWRSTGMRRSAGLLMLAGLASGAWIMSQRSFQVSSGPKDVTSAPLMDTLKLIAPAPVTWTFQSIAAFPYRDQAAPNIVYVVALLVFVCLLAAAFRFGDRTARIVLGGLVLAGLLIPIALTLATVSQYGVVWQGRYGLPFTLGVPMVAGYALDRAGQLRHLPAVVWAIVGTLFVLTQVPGLTNVSSNEHRSSPQAGTAAWWALPVWAVAVLATTGALVMVWGAWRATGVSVTAIET